MSQDLPNPIESAVAPGPVKAGRGIINRALNVLLGGALVLAVGGIAFAAGRLTAPAQTIAGTFPAGGPLNGQGGPGGNGQGGIFATGAGPSIEGTVESITDTTLTLRTADGQTIQVALNGDTSYHAQTDANASDVVTGSRVLVRLDLRRGGGANGPSATAGTGTTGMTANDVTVVP